MSDLAGGGDRPASVDAWAEADVAVVLGSSDAQAARVVQLLVAHDLLAHGVAVVAAAAGARWGLPSGEALQELAQGRALHGAFSDYELRTGREEAESDLEEAVGAAGWGDRPDGRRWDAIGLERIVVVASPHHLRPPVPPALEP